MTQAPEAPARSRARISERTFRQDKWWQSPRQPMVPMRTELLELFDISELKKYMTDEELAGLSGYSAGAAEEKH
jgi:hypothetical protein